jgi:hypothetical protein
VAKLAIGFGVALIILGIVGWIPHHAPTALIPAYAGALIGICGLVANNPAYRMHAMHVAVLVALLTMIGSGVMLILALLHRRSPSALGLASQIGTAVLSAVLVVMCVQSFVAARRQRGASA